jgi:hypothetical protein
LNSSNRDLSSVILNSDAPNIFRGGERRERERGEGGREREREKCHCGKCMHNIIISN